MTVYTVQSSFSRGEMTPKLIDRQSYDQYRLGMSTCSNFVILRHGGVTVRPGTKFITEVKDSSKTVRLVPYEFNNVNNQNYMLEFGDYYMRVIKDQGQLIYGSYSMTLATQTNPVRITLDNHPFSAADSIDISGVVGMTELNGNTYTVTNVNPAYTVTGITQANPAVVTCSGGHNHQNGDSVLLQNIGGMGEVSNNVYTIANRTGTTFELSGVDSSAYGAFTSGGTARLLRDSFELSAVNGTGYTAYTSDGDVEFTSETVVEIATPYAEADLPNLDFSYSLDVMYIAHPSYAPRRLSRTGHTLWFLNIVLPIDGPYLAKNFTGNHAELGGDIISGTQTTVVFDNLTNINKGAGFSSADLGRAFRWEKKYATVDEDTDVSTSNDFLIAWGYIQAVNSETSVDVAWEGTAGEENLAGQLIVDVLDGSTPDTVDGGDSDRSNWWWLGAWYGNDNWPAKVRFFGDAERIAWGRTNEYPLTVWFSRSADFENFAVTDKDGQVLDDSGFTHTINSDGGHPILWLADGSNALVVGTSKHIHGIRPATENEVFSPNNRKASKFSENGASEVNPALVGESMLYVSRYGTQLRELVYSFSSNAYETPDSSILAEHLLKQGVSGEPFYANYPNANVWMYNSDGKMPILTYERDQKTVGWGQGIIAGGNADSWGIVEGAAVIQGTSRDEPYVVVKRTVNGNTVRYIEMIEAPFDSAAGDDSTLAPYLDSNVKYDGAGTTTLSSGFDHLRGETCDIVVNGIHQGTIDVPEAGSLTIPNGLTATKVVLGYRYEPRIKMLPPPVTNPDGTLIGRKKMIPEATLSVFETSKSSGIEVGFVRDSTDYFVSLYPEVVDFSVPTAPDVVSERMKVELEDTWGEESQLEIKITKPYPCTILSVQTLIDMEP